MEAAKKLFVQEGYEATSIRKIAREIEFSPTTIYLYYKDKSDIVYALHQVGFGILRDRFFPLMVVEDPFERLKALGKIYIQFALSNPEYYQVMFMMKEPISFLNAKEDKAGWIEGEYVIEFLRKTIIDCQELGFFREMDPVAVAIQAWGAVHGLVSLHITQHMDCIKDIFERNDTMDEMVYASFKVFVEMIANSK